MTSQLMQHPDELRLVAFAENRLLDFERDELEAHLADCPTCRSLVAELAKDTQAADGPIDAPLRIIKPRRPAAKGVWPVLLAAAALLLLARIIPWNSTAPETSSFEIALAGTRDEVFQSQRSAETPAGEFYVGVRLETTSWVRLVGFDQSGLALEIPLDETGATNIQYDGSTEYIFGPYPMQLDEDQRVHTVAAFVSDESLDWESVRSVTWTLDADPAQWQETAAALGASVQLLRAQSQN